jgi:hypothetical protein
MLNFFSADHSIGILLPLLQSKDALREGSSLPELVNFRR